jgi:predicted DNA-binding WGR domain protein
MRVFLQHNPDGTEPAHYLQLTLQLDLFGGWELLQESGQVGGRSRLRRQQFADPAEAQAAFDKARDAELRRGYQITYASEGPR